MKIVTTIMYGLLLLAVLVGVGMFLLPGSGLMGDAEIKIVQSGSMEPSIRTGSIVLIAPQPSYGVGDVITFTSTDSDVPTTHRIMEVKVDDAGATWFLTKGDANENFDTAPVAATDVLGAVRFSVPYLGFLFDFARTPLGFALLIGIPAFLIIIDEVEKIWREVRRRRKHSDDDNETPTAATDTTAPAATAPSVISGHSLRELRLVDMRRSLPTPLMIIPSVTPVGSAPAVSLCHPFFRPLITPLLSVLVTVAVGAFAVIITTTSSTTAYFTDREAALGNALAAIAVGFSVESSEDRLTLDPATSATLTHTITPHTNSAPLTHRLVAQMATGTLALCDTLTLTSTNPLLPYDGQLLELDVTTNLPSTLDLTIGASAAAPANEQCTVAFTYTAWPDGGYTLTNAFSDTETILLTVQTHAAASEAAGIPPPTMRDLESDDSDLMPPDVATSSSSTTDTSSEDETTTPPTDEGDGVDDMAPDAITPTETIPEPPDPPTGTSDDASTLPEPTDDENDAAVPTDSAEAIAP
jgi:signal peptidase I